MRWRLWGALLLCAAGVARSELEHAPSARAETKDAGSPRVESMPAANPGVRDAGSPGKQGAAALAPRDASAGDRAAQGTSSRERLAAIEGKAAAACSARPEIDRCVTTSIAHVLDVSERIAKNFPSQAAAWRARAESQLAAAERGEDPYASQRGKIVSRGYRSPISQRVQGYTIYVPPDYTPQKKWPLMIVLHGGSSNGNLFLGVVLGNNMDWKSYDKHLWDEYTPRWSPPFIVAAPDGYGQVLWRWMGEQDVLDVIADIERNYSVDGERIVLSGLSNGGVGAYAIGSRHAYRFSVVQAIAGAPSWIQYAGPGSVGSLEAKLMRPWSAMDLAENWFNTDFRYYHGTVDPGPMRPPYVRELDQLLAQKKIPHSGKWFETGHDLLYLVHRHGKVYAELEGVRRKSAPSEVRLVTGDYRAARQHWLEVTRFASYPDLVRLSGRSDGTRVDITTENAAAFAIHVQELPKGEKLTVHVDGSRVYEGPRSALGARLDLIKRASWERGVPATNALEKKPGLSGPMTDAYYGRTVHVYGTQRAENTAALKQVAERAARGLPLWLWSVEQEVVPDTAVDASLLKDAHVVLYGTPGDNRVLDRLAPKLPIRIEGDAVVLGSERLRERGVGTRFIYPNPESADRYLIVQTAPTLDGVKRGLNLPDFVPDWVVYDASTAATRARLVPSKRAPRRGFFGAKWELIAP